MNGCVANESGVSVSAMGDSARVLMIACAFPPTGGPGVQRSLKFVKYLPAFGWMPTVWASEALPGLPEDSSLLGDVPSQVSVHRLRQDRMAQVAAWIDRAAGVRGLPGGSVLRRGVMRLRVHRARTLLPDDQIGWARRSVIPVVRLFREAHMDLIYSTYSPASNHWLALQIKRRTGVPWVADFRDLWTDDYRYDEPSSRRRAAHRALEQDVLDAADAVIGVSDRQTALLARRVGASGAKFHTITNGFDPGDFPPCNGDATVSRPASSDGSCPCAGRFTIAHVGRLDHRRTPDVLFDGLARFARATGSTPDRTAFEAIGHATRVVIERLGASGLSVRHAGYVSHANAIARMVRADLLLLPVPTGPNADSVISAKLFEYLATGRAILVIGPDDGEAARIVNQCHAGRAVGLDADAIAEALRDFHDAWAAGRPIMGCAPECLDPFHRIRLTQRLATVFDGLTERSSHGVSGIRSTPDVTIRAGRRDSAAHSPSTEAVEAVS